MVEEREIQNLSDVYNDMDTEGKKNMFLAAKNLLTGQQVLKTENVISEVKIKKVELKIEN